MKHVLSIPVSTILSILVTLVSGFVRERHSMPPSSSASVAFITARRTRSCSSIHDSAGGAGGRRRSTRNSALSLHCGPEQQQQPNQQQVRCSRRSNKQSRPSSALASTTTRQSSAASQQQKQQRRQRPPLVDSTLLRFVYWQKKQQVRAEQSAPSTPATIPKASTTTTTQTLPGRLARLSRQTSSTSFTSSSPSSSPLATTIMTTNTTTFATTSPSPTPTLNAMNTNSMMIVNTESFMSRENRNPFLPYVQEVIPPPQPPPLINTVSSFASRENKIKNTGVGSTVSGDGIDTTTTATTSSSNNNDSSSSSSSSSSNNVDDFYSAWLRQYNRNRVAQVLNARLQSDDDVKRSNNENGTRAMNSKALASTTVTTTSSIYTLDQEQEDNDFSLPPSAAAAVTTVTSRDAVVQASIALAGERVQMQALTRTARRRLREFLKRSDETWLETGMVTDGNGASRTTYATTFPRTAGIIVGGSNSVITNAPRDVEREYRLDNFVGVVDLLLENGLRIRDIAEILIHSPSVAMMQPRPIPGVTGEGETLQETLDRVLVQLLGKTLGLRLTDARKILRDTPGLLTMRGSKSATDMVDMMVQLQVSATSIARKSNKAELPALLSRSPSAVFRFVAFLSSDAIRMPVKQIGPLLRRSNCQELLNAVAPVQRLEMARRTRDQLNRFIASGDTNNTGSNSDAPVFQDTLAEEYLKLDDDMNGPICADAGMQAALYGRTSQDRREQINDNYRRMSETAWLLRNEIGTADLGKVIAAYPSVLLLDAKEQILPVTQYLIHKLGIWEDDLPRVLELFPVLLGKPLEEMKRVESYLLSLDISSESLCSIFRSFPVLLTLDVESQMKPVVEFLRHTVGVNNVGRFVTRVPAVLGYSVDGDLRPKWDFLLKVTTDARFEVSRFPAYFSYPMDRVIRVRFSYLEEVKNIPIPLMPRLDTVLRYGDNDFATKVARDADGGRRFAEFASQSTPKRALQRST